MSIANLFSPNDYNLFCNSITPSTTAPGSGIFSDYIDTVGLGDPMRIGTTKAGSMFIGNPTIQVTLQGGVHVTQSLLVDTIGSNTGVGMEIAGNASGVAIIPQVGDIAIDDNVPTGNRMHLGDANIGSVTIGKVGGSVDILAPITVGGAGVPLSVFNVMTRISATGVGCIPSTANYVQFNATLINSIVFLQWRFLGPVTAATVASNLNFVETIPLSFRPPVGLTFPATCFGNTVAPLPVTTAGQLPGELTVQANGTLFFSFNAMTHNGVTTWNIGEAAQVGAGSCAFSVI